MSDVEHVHRFIVEIPAYGDPEKEHDRSKLQLARALHHMVKPGCSVQDAVLEEGDPLTPITPGPRFIPLGKPAVLDPKGDDMGNHGPAHAVPLVEVDHG